jgi:hypothetical protein
MSTHPPPALPPHARPPRVKPRFLPMLAGAGALALLTACAHAPSPESAVPRVAGAPAGEGGAPCPMGVPGARVSAADTADGAVLTFTAPDQVVELRSRVHALGQLHNRNDADGGSGRSVMGGGGMGQGMMGNGQPMEGRSMPASHVQIADLDGGASLTLVPDAPEDLPRLQAVARQHARRLQEHGCEFLGLSEDEGS